MTSPARPDAPDATDGDARSQATAGRLDFRFADGLRGLAALVVCVFHAYLATGRAGDTTRDLPRPFAYLALGDMAVPVFIVLSGFVLMLPAARAPGLALKGGWRGFLRRRARRILPPYYAAFAGFLVLELCLPIMRVPHGTQWDSKLPLTWGKVVAHVFVVHNFIRAAEIAVDPPAWSVATEWQLYLLLPLVLLPLWRAFGGAVAVPAAIAAGVAVHHWLPGLDSAHPWYLGLFAMGMAAAWVSARGVRVRALGPLAVAALAVVGFGLVRWLPLVNHLQLTSETCLGAALALGLAWLARRSLDGRRTPVHRLLESRLPVWLGLWSYSMYLVHDPLLNLGNLLLLGTPMSTAARFAVEAGVVLPIALAGAYLFHRVVERRFLTTHQRATRASEDGEPELSDRPRAALSLASADVTVR